MMIEPSQEVLQEVFERLWTYTVSAFALPDEDLDGPGTYVGTGTLVYAHGEPCLLTADHVWEELCKYKVFGFTVRKDRKGISIPASLNVTRHRGGEDGPDIALVRLPPIDASELKEGRGKAFFNLDKRRTDPPPELGVTLWMIIGAPGEKATISEKDRERIMPTSIFGTMVARHTERAGFDYVEVRSKHDGKDGRPVSYGGLSGSGLWRVGLQLNTEKRTAAWDGTADLSGVAFLQMYDPESRNGMIRCHGRRSVYSLA